MTKKQSSIAVCLEVRGYYPDYISAEDRKAIVDRWERLASMAGSKNMYTIVKNPDWGWEVKHI